MQAIHGSSGAAKWPIFQEAAIIMPKETFAFFARKRQAQRRPLQGSCGHLAKEPFLSVGFPSPASLPACHLSSATPTGYNLRLESC